MNTLWADLLVPLLTGICGALLGIVLLQRNVLPHPSPMLPDHDSRWYRRRDAIWGTGTVEKPLLFRRLGIAVLLQMILFVVLDSLVSSHMANFSGKGLPFGILLLISLLCTGSVLLSLWRAERRESRLLRRLALLSVVLLVAEVAVFQGKSFCNVSEQVLLSPESVQIVTEDNATRADGTIAMTGDTTLTVAPETLPSTVGAIQIRLKQKKDGELFRVQTAIKDDNFSQTFQVIGEKYAAGQGRSCDFKVDPYGTLREIQLKFSELKSSVTLESVVLYSAVPYAFSAVRYLLLFAALGLVQWIRVYALYRIPYDRTKFRHRAAVLVMTLVCAASALLFLRPNLTTISYPLVNGAAGYDPYVQTFDALRHGRVTLDLDAAPELAELDNVYDNSERNASGISYAWDRAYYNGHYYSYFGITPVLVFYYPFYWLRGALPPLGIAVTFFSVLSILFLCGAVMAFVRAFVPRANLLLLLGCLPAAVCCSGVYFSLQYADLYYLAVVTASCFLLLAVWLGIQGSVHFAGKPVRRTLCLAGSGLSLILCVGARPSAAVAAAILIPLFLGVLVRKQSTWKCRLSQAAAFLVPLLAGLGGIFAYNQLRFGSPLDFGAAYQLTTSDIHAYHLQLSQLPAAIYHDLLQLPKMSNTFPFFGVQSLSLNSYQAYRYVADALGVCSYPLLLCGFLLLPRVLRQPGSETLQGVTLRQQRAVFALCFLLPVVMAWLNFCMGGVNMRYVIDLLPPAVLGSVGCLLRCNSGTARRGDSAARYRLSWLVLLGSVGMVVLLMFSIVNQGLTKHNPNLYEAVEDLVIFWQ